MKTYDSPFSHTSISAPASPRRRHFEAFIKSAHPCVGALSALHRNRAHFGEFDRLGGGRDIDRLCSSLRAFSDAYPEPTDDPVTFIAMFADALGTEDDFETSIWRHLQDLHDADSPYFDWNPVVSADPSSPEFSFCVGGRAFYVIGLHPAASRIARRAPMPCLVFNFHDQFESLRLSGKYAGFQRITRSREMSLQGSINPALAQFGVASEVRQYSGRNVPPEWQCPFHTGKTNVA